MKELSRLWIISFSNPVGLFRLFQLSGGVQAAKFTWWTTLFIYLLSYLSLSFILFGFNAIRLGALVFLLVFTLVTSLTLIKNYFYTLILSYKTKSFIAYYEICLITALSDTPLLLGLPVFYLLSLWAGGGFVFILLLGFMFYLLRSRANLFRTLYGVSTRFVYMISFGIWMNIFILFSLFLIYIGVSLQVLMSYFL